MEAAKKFKPLKEILHQYIDEADEDKLEAIYTLVKEEINYRYTGEQIAELYKRRESYLKGEGRFYTKEEFFDSFKGQEK
jgi:hypothetical protein